MTEPREVLAGSVRRAAAGARLIGRTHPDNPVHVSVILSRRNAIGSEMLRRHGLTRPHERPKADHALFAQKYGASDAAVEAITAFASRYGLEVQRTDTLRRVVGLRGSVADMERAFVTELHDCAVGKRVYRVRRGPLLIPRGLAPHVDAVLGLDNRPVAKPRLRPRSIGPAYYPQELAALYEFPSGDGAGQTVALIELGGNYGADDLETYCRAAGVATVPNIRGVNVGSYTPPAYGEDPESDGEVMLDIEVVAAIAPGASIVVYFAENTDQGFYEAASQAIHDPATTAVSISWGSPEKDWSDQSMDAWNALGQSATLLNVPVFVAAGDHGCADEENTDPNYDAQRHADFPGTCTDGVISCGGTCLLTDQGAITSETVWNDGDGWATGGGVSAHFPAPEWQNGLSAEDGSPLRMRGVPDVAGTADPRTGIKVRVNGSDGVTGGTSAVAPQWAALAALLSQQLGHKVGFFLPLLYQYSDAQATRDILSGNNSVFEVAGFSAHNGWDACTGLGSPNGAKLLALLREPVPALNVTPSGSDTASAVTVPVPVEESSSSVPSTLSVRAAAPFDPRAATLYGQFVRAAYTMYDADPNNRTPAPSADFPADYELTAWVLMQDFILGSTNPTFYGFVARSNANPNAFVLAIRGTSNGVEWWDDANAIVRTPFRVPGCGRVGSGFARIYDTLEVLERPSGQAAPSAAGSLRSVGSFSRQVSALVKRHAATRARAVGVPEGASIEVTGHSLGAALATLYVMENAHNDKVTSPMLCTFASPLVGDATFVSAFNALGLTSWRIVNQPDLVPKLPPEVFGFRHVDQLELFSSSGRVKPSVGCWHAMDTYLSLVNPDLQPGAGCRVSAVPAVAPGPRDAVSTITIPGGAVTVNIVVDVEGEGRLRKPVAG